MPNTYDPRYEVSKGVQEIVAANEEQIRTLDKLLLRGYSLVNPIPKSNN